MNEINDKVKIKKTITARGTIIKSVSFELHPDNFCSKNEKFAGRYNKHLSRKYFNRMIRLVSYLRENKKITFHDKEKVLVKVMVFRHNFRSDPINLSEFINDAVKKAIDVDDRYFSESIDWEVDKIRPRVILTIKQEQTIK